MEASVEKPLAGGNNTVLVFLQDACLNHQYIRSRVASSHIVERPERVRAVKVGLAATVSCLEDSTSSPLHPAKEVAPSDPAKSSDADDLAAALNRMKLDTKTEIPLRIIHSSATVDILNDPAVKFVHGDIDGDVYLENLIQWVAASNDNIAKEKSEIPETLPQNDLYLCPGSLDAMQGAIGTVCEAIDSVVQGVHDSPMPSAATRAFCVVRPPGHHCGEDTPSGFCFVNNVAIGAAHAHLKHGINRVVILDIDLHHGNGTQSIVWQINEETYRQSSEDDGEESKPLQKPSLQVYYGSIHDILSFPCEDGKPQLVQAASVSIHGHHGQHIENIHLLPYESEEDFFTRLYDGPYSKLLHKAQEFVESTGATQDDVLVFISCGFDACEHEYPSMSRHNRKVPVGFYHRFTKDVCSFADKFAKGRVVSVLEGGYSDRALTSGTIAHLSGFVDVKLEVARGWWNEEILNTLEKATKKKRGARPSMVSTINSWLERTVNLFETLGGHKSPKFTSPMPVTRALRERKKNESKDVSADSSRAATPRVDNRDVDKTEAPVESAPIPIIKKLPRVILKVGPPPNSTS